MSHAGFDSDWWHPEDWKAVYDAARGYNVILYLFGHTGTGVWYWAPEGETKKWTCINDGHTTSGFFVIQVKGDRLRAAYRYKQDLKVTRNPDRTYTHQWNGEWDWKLLLEKKMAESSTASTRSPGADAEFGTPARPRIPSSPPVDGKTYCAGRTGVECGF
jgi:hypothetical protein